MKKIITIVIMLFAINMYSQITLIPDPQFENYLIELDIDSDGIINGQVLTSDIDTVITLDLNHEYVQDLTGIEDFAALEFLDVSGNELTVLDVSNNLQLKELYCSSSSAGFSMLFSSLDLSNNVNLELLYAENLIFLENLNLKNGNNSLLLIVDLGCEYEGNPCELTELNCVTVDNEEDATNDEPPYSNWYIQADYFYSEDCSLGLLSEKVNVLSVYPNPTKDYLYIRNKNIDILKIDIFDILGKKVFTKNEALNQLDVSDLKSGILFMKIETERGTVTQRIIKV